MTTSTPAPNVLFILADQHNAKVLGSAGHPTVKTPNLDRLAAEGVRFDNAVTQNPICTPSRVCWLSGQYCHNHGYYGLNGANPGGLPTILGHFRNEGYKTTAIGKIHCPEYWVEDDADIFHETCFCSIGGRSPEYTAFLKERGKEHLEDHTTLPEFGAKGTQKLDSRPSPLEFDESQEGWIANQCAKQIRQAADKDQPFFIHASFPRPHQCTTPCQEFWDMNDEDDLYLPPNADSELTGRAPHMRAAAEQWRQGDWAMFEPKTFEAARRRKLRGYFGAISQVDHAVGVLLDALDTAGLADNTIVVYSSDHGEYAAEHGIMEKAPGICSDAVTRIPMIWRWPGRFKAGHIATEVVETVDMATTLCVLTNLDPFETGDGRDVTAMLNGEAGDPTRLGVTEFAWSRSVRKGKFRLVYYPKTMFPEDYPEGFGELYDLENDPWEMKNLYFEPQYIDLRTQLREDLLDWLVTTARPAVVNGVNGGRTATDRWPLNNQRRLRHKTIINLDGKISPAWIDHPWTNRYL